MEDRCARTLSSLILVALVLVRPLAADMSRGEGELELAPRPPENHGVSGPHIDPVTTAWPSARRVTVVWHDVHGLLPAGFEELSASVTAVFREAGVDLEWCQAADAAPFAGEGVEIPVVVLAEDVRPGRRRHNALAATWRGSEPRTVWLYLGAFWRTLGRGALPPRLSQAEGRRLARPLAHVVIHELVHALAPDREHTHTGVLKGVYGRGELTAPLDGIGALEVRGLLEGLESIASQRARPKDPLRF